MESVCLDTHILIWGIKEECEVGQEHMVAIAKAFFAESDNKKDLQILIPSVVIAEFLMRIPVSQHKTIMNLLSRSFQIPPFDMASASYFAEIWQSKEEVKQSLHGIVSREVMKVDCQIVAIAKQKNVDCIFSHDSNLAKFAEGHVAIRELPREAKQMVLAFE